MNRTLLGCWGEAQAAAYLRTRGYTLEASGYRCRFGEIDLIASRGEILAFVEVKLRKNSAFASPREFVDGRKQQRIRTTAECYLAETGSLLQPRFDVAEVYAPEGTDTADPVITYYENAF